MPRIVVRRDKAGAQCEVAEPLVVLAVIALFRKYIVPTSPKLAFFSTDRGGAVLALFGAIATSFVAAGAADGPHTVSQVISAAFLFMITNQTLFTIMKKLIAPTGPELAKEVTVESQATGEQVQANAEKSAQDAADALNSVGK